MRTIGIIPARYGSTRFPGKPLAKLGDKPVIQWVYTAARQVLDDVVVATDDQRIVNAVERFGGKAIMTGTAHDCGTSRVHEAYHLLHSDSEIVLNIQGDEPFVQPHHLLSLLRCFDTAETQIATLATPFDTEQPFDTVFDVNRTKVVIDYNGNALYFSRSVIPFVRSKPYQEWLGQAPFYQHLGIYAYRAHTLDAIATLPPSPLELAESLEQLRWLYNGYRVRTRIVDAHTVGIDTLEDLILANKLITKYPDLTK